MELIYAFIHTTARSDPVTRIGCINMEHNSGWPWSWALGQYWGNKPWLKWHDSKTRKAVWERSVAAAVEIHHGGKKKSYSISSYKLSHLSRGVFIARGTELVLWSRVGNVIHSLCVQPGEGDRVQTSTDRLLCQLNHNCRQRLLLWPTQPSDQCNPKPREVKIKNSSPALGRAALRDLILQPLTGSSFLTERTLQALCGTRLHDWRPSRPVPMWPLLPALDWQFHQRFWWIQVGRCG